MEKLLFLTTLVVVAKCNVIPSPLSPADEALFDNYGNFTTAIAKALVDNDIAVNSGPHSSVTSACTNPVGIQVTSAFGLGHLLAILNENVWKVGVPVFQDVLTSAPKTLSDSFELIFKKLVQTPDISFSSAVFTSDSLSITPSLTKLKVEVVNTDLTQSTTTGAINAYLTKFIGQPLDQTYIPKDATISPAAKAILVDTLHVSEAWNSAVTKVAVPVKFNGGDTVDMIEIKGAFQVMENDNAVEVIVPFKTNRAISFVLPTNVATALNGNLGEPKLVNYTSVRIQIPIFKTTVRNYQADLTNRCNFNKEANFFQLLDHVIQISLDDQKFEATSITSAQINDVTKFKAAPQTDKVVTPSPPCSTVTPKQDSIPAPPPAIGAEKVVIFDHTFSWTLLDQDLGPIMAGTVISPKSPSVSSLAGAFVFGLESPLGYAKCL